MWGSPLIIDHLISPASDEILRAKEHDKLVLTWEQRRWLRGRFTTDKGRKIGLALPTGTTLDPVVSSAMAATRSPFTPTAASAFRVASTNASI